MESPPPREQISLALRVHLNPRLHFFPELGILSFTAPSFFPQTRISGYYKYSRVTSRRPFLPLPERALLLIQQSGNFLFMFKCMWLLEDKRAKLS